MSKIHIDKSELKSLLESGMSVRDTAKHFGVAKNTIQSRIREYGIKRKPKLSREIIENELPKFYKIMDFANHYGFNPRTVSTYITRHNIDYKLKSDVLLENKEWLYEQYVTQNKTLVQLENELQVSRKRINEYIRKHKIPKKPRYKEKVWFVDENKVIKLAKQGLTSKEIAIQSGCSEEYIRQIQIKNNLPRLEGVNRSSHEKELCKYLDSLGIKYETNKKGIIGKYEIDVWIPSHKLAIEINGVYWHSEKFVKNDYHYTKRKLAEDNGIRLIQIFEDTWIDKKDIVLSHISHCLGLSTKKIYARKCEVIIDIPIQDRKQFFENTHIQGYANSNFSIGLKYNDEYVAMMLFMNDTLVRYATKYHVVGGFSKLLKHSGKQHIKTFVDYTLFDGNMYEKCGLIKTRELPPDYKYLYRNRLHHKFNFRKQRFKTDDNLGYHDGLSERELAKLNNIRRVYDAGKGVYEINLEENKCHK